MRQRTTKQTSSKRTASGKKGQLKTKKPALTLNWTFQSKLLYVGTITQGKKKMFVELERLSASEPFELRISDAHHGKIDSPSDDAVLAAVRTLLTKQA